jgi:hypothetical protein
MTSSTSEGARDWGRYVRMTPPRLLPGPASKSGGLSVCLAAHEHEPQTGVFCTSTKI